MLNAIVHSALPAVIVYSAFHALPQRLVRVAGLEAIVAYTHVNVSLPVKPTVTVSPGFARDPLALFD